MKDALVEKFANLFKGYENAHGQHELNAEPDAEGKVKGRASTKAYGPSEVEYLAHLKGKGTSLGIIPLCEDNTCWFGAIDVDIRGEAKLHEPIEELEARIRSLDLPLVVCRSKSGGAHLYAFFERPVEARIVQAKLTELSALLGYGGCEVFPKQVMRVNAEDRGNWINIAFYGALTDEGTQRYCLRNGKRITDLGEFLEYAEMSRVSVTAFRDKKVKLAPIFEDGPPCLQHLATFGIDNNRNVAIMNVAIYFKKKDPDNWQDKTIKFNYEHVKPSLDLSEVNQILKNISRKEYFYTCKNPPICNHCDKRLCAKREFGITYGSKADDVFPIDNLTKCVSRDSVRWYAENQGNRIVLTTDQLLNPRELQRIFLEKLSQVIIPGKHREWHERLRELMETCQEVADPDDASREGQFLQLLDSFFSASRPARNKDELLKGNSYHEGGRIHFRSEDLTAYLGTRRFQHQPHDIWTWLKEAGATHTQMRVKGRMVRVWSVPEPECFDDTPIELPASIEEEL